MGQPRGFEHRATNPAVRTPTNADLAWIAGFLEGEGCFYGTDSGQSIQASQVNPEPLGKLLELLGGRVLKKKGHGSSKDFWLWKVAGSRARGIMLTLWPLMSYKRQEQIKKAMTSC